MSQHFLLSAASRTLSLKGIYQMGEAKAYETFCQMRWEGGQATCPRCGCLDTYHISTRRKFKCKGCSYQFSVTSGTIFASRKMSFTDLLAAICLIVNGAKGISMIQMSRDLNCQYKTAFVLAHKIREAMGSDRPAMPLEGDVEVDGMYNGGYVRPANLKENRVDRRLAENQTGKRRVVVAFRQRKGRTLPFVVRSEAEGVELAMQHVSRMATMHADEASHWDRLHDGWQVGRINHSEAYATLESCTNQVESYFSRLRRMIQGQHHFVSGRYLHQYANHAAWLEDHRGLPNGELAGRVGDLALAHPVSRVWKGYWQGGK
ncbi:MAG: IS1595 family transposase [Aestuariivirga sp.]|nr:IS1595 family transposase [Aestuariivirga sp.]